MLMLLLSSLLFCSAIAQIAALFNVPYISIRVISNNITNDSVYDLKVADTCQEFVKLVSERYYYSSLLINEKADQSGNNS